MYRGVGEKRLALSDPAFVSCTTDLEVAVGSVRFWLHRFSVEWVFVILCANVCLYVYACVRMWCIYVRALCVCLGGWVCTRACV